MGTNYLHAVFSLWTRTVNNVHADKDKFNKGPIIRVIIKEG